MDYRAIQNISLVHLPAYAKYISDHKFSEFVDIQRELAHKMDLPMLRLASQLPQSSAQVFFEQSAARMLSALHTQSIGDYQELAHYQIVPDDITILSFIRRKAFRDLLHDYTRDWTLGLRIMEEIDLFLTVESASLIQQQSEKMVQQEDRHFKMIEEVEDYAILQLSRNGLIENWNRGAEKIKGYSAAEIIGSHLRTFYTQEDQEAKLPEQLIEEAALHGRATHEGWRVRKNGERFWAYVVITALHDEFGTVTGFLKVTRDLSAKKLSEDMLQSYTTQLEEKNLELEVKNKELESFAYVASHDLQEPVRKIRLWANRLEGIVGLPENAKAAVSKIMVSTGRMQDLIAGVLNYVQTDDGNKNFVSADLNILVHEVLEDFTETLEEKKATVLVDRLPALFVIPLQIKQLFSNLISNAIKYARPEAALNLAIKCEAVAATDTAAKSIWQLTVSDNGIGFPQEQAEKVFDIFKRLVGKDVAGTGIGLALCRKIVQNHGGTIRAESTPKVGTNFIISLPAMAEGT